MKKVFRVGAVVFLGLLVVAGITAVCLQLKYLEFKDNVIGKTSIEVQERYGKFDNSYTSPDADGEYRQTVCSYIVIRKRVGLLGTEPPYLVSISFDANGIADDVFFQQGGFGG